MCGIVGALGHLPPEEVIIKASDSLRHRGPDDAGLYIDTKEQIALAHRRLSIIDTSSAGHQPFFSQDKKITLVFNGEIYNYLELKEELSKDYNFQTKTDTEVLLAAYIKWGSDFLQHLQGMFALAIWDDNKKRLLIARDRLGIKPLYYYIKNKRLIFASEIKAILQFPNIERKLNKQGFLDYLSYRYALGDNTLFSDIYSLNPGYCLIADHNQEPKFVQYWDLPIVVDKKDSGEKEVLETVEKLLIDTVKSHMISDVPVGAYLSGGLDSSLLVALMSKITNKKIKTFSIGFKEDGFNEFQYAREVAELYQTEHKEILLDSQNYIDLLAEVIKFKDEPLSVPNEVALHVLSKELKKDITVVLSGEGADELFGGYGRIFRSGDDFEKMEMLKDPNFLSEQDREILQKNLKEKYGDFNNYSNLDHFLSQYNYFFVQQKNSLLNKDLFNNERINLLNAEYFDAFLKRLKSLSAIEKYMYIFQKTHLLGLMRRLDANTMSESVEGRVPFVDHRLVEYVSALPLKYKLSWKSAQSSQEAVLLNGDQISEKYDITKSILRKIAEKYLPASITERKKVGFPVPLDDWFKGGLKKYAKDSLLSADARSRVLYNQEFLSECLNQDNNSINSLNGYNIWMLINIEIWMREYNIVI